MWNPIDMMGVIFGIVLPVAILLYAFLRKKEWSAGETLLLAVITMVLLAALFGVGVSLLDRAKTYSTLWAMCRWNVKTIGEAVLRYETEHENRLPDSLGILLKEGYVEEMRTFFCPSKAEWQTLSRQQFDPADASVLKRVDADSDYAIVKRHSPAAPPDAIIVYEKACNHAAGRSCFFKDGTTSWLSEEDFQERIKAQEAQIRERTRKDVE